VGNKVAKEIAQKVAQDKKWKDDIVVIQRNLVKQAKLQNSILSEQQKAITTLANESIMKIDVNSVSSAKRPFYEWKQKKILERIA
jgi:hypothetical protein